MVMWGPDLLSIAQLAQLFSAVFLDVLRNEARLEPDAHVERGFEAVVAVCHEDGHCRTVFLYHQLLDKVFLLHFPCQGCLNEVQSEEKSLYRKTEHCRLDLTDALDRLE